MGVGVAGAGTTQETGDGNGRHGQRGRRQQEADLPDRTLGDMEVELVVHVEFGVVRPHKGQRFG